MALVHTSGLAHISSPSLVLKPRRKRRRLARKKSSTNRHSIHLYGTTAACALRNFPPQHVASQDPVTHSPLPRTSFFSAQTSSTPPSITHCLRPTTRQLRPSLSRYSPTSSTHWAQTLPFNNTCTTSPCTPRHCALPSTASCSPASQQQQATSRSPSSPRASTTYPAHARPSTPARSTAACPRTSRPAPSAALPASLAWPKSAQQSSPTVRA